jgi:hypothetical protein
MKNVAFIFAFAGALLFTRCSNGEHKHSHDSTPVEATAHEHDHAHEHDAPAKELALNNGSKWKTDEATKTNVAALQAIVSEFDASGDQSLAGYTSTGKKLNEGVTQLVSACTMSGADHDALHTWLEPLMGSIHALEKANDLESAAAAYHKISERLALFNTYFD